MFAFFAGISCYKETLGLASSVIDIWMLLICSSQVLNNGLLCLPGMCYFLNTSWCVAFQINGWGSSTNVIINAWSEGKRKKTEAFFLSTKMHILLTHPSYSFGELRGKKTYRLEDDSWESKWERMDENASLKCGSVLKILQSGRHIFIYISIF